MDFLIVALSPGVAAAIALMFLPALVELKRPKDAGPRLVNGYFELMGLSSLKTPLTNMEVEGELRGQLQLPIFPLVFNLETS